MTSDPSSTTRTNERFRLAIATVAEGPEWLPESALLAGAVEDLGGRALPLAVDACAAEDAFQASLKALDVRALALPWHREWRELASHVVGLARDVQVPALLFGDGLVRLEGDGHPMPEGALQLAHPGPADLAAALELHAPDPEAPRPSWAWMAGAGLGGRSIAAALFAEPGTLGCIAGTSRREALAPTALLARLEAPAAAHQACDPAAMVRALEPVVAGLERLEWWDRGFAPSLETCLEVLRARFPDLRHALRPAPSDLEDAERLGRLAALGVDRVILEIDAIEEGPALSGQVFTASAAREAAARVQAAGLEVAVVLVVGLPGESPERAARRLEDVRAIDPVRLRCVPFEATGGHPARDHLQAKGWLPVIDDPWIREVHRPLVLPELDAEAFHLIWAAALDLLAEVEVRAEEPGR